MQQVTYPEDACEPVERPDTRGRPWIGLVVRSERLRTNCSFDVKVCARVCRLGVCDTFMGHE